MATLEEWLSTTEPGLQADSCFFFLLLVSSGEKSLLINHFNFGCYRLEWYAVLFAFFFWLASGYYRKAKSSTYKDFYPCLCLTLCKVVFIVCRSGAKWKKVGFSA